jgi:hypothetical protein
MDMPARSRVIAEPGEILLPDANPAAAGGALVHVVRPSTRRLCRSEPGHRKAYRFDPGNTLLGGTIHIVAGNRLAPLASGTVQTNSEPMDFQTRPPIEFSNKGYSCV